MTEPQLSGEPQGAALIALIQKLPVRHLNLSTKYFILCSLYHSGDDAQLRSLSTIISGAIAALLFVVIIILVVLIAILYFRKKSQRKQKLSINPEAGNNTYCNSGKCTCLAKLLVQLCIMYSTAQITMLLGSIGAHRLVFTYIGCFHV